MKDRILLFLMKLMPTHFVSRLAGSLAEKTYSRNIIPFFAKQFKIMTEEAEKPLAEYNSLNEFFTRRLKPGSREVCAEQQTVVSPSDGKIAAFGTVEKGKLLQAKGVFYSVQELLGITEEESKKYEGGTFITIYLSPRDYHRVHSPVSGTITHFTYLPGTLFPVNAFGVRVVEGLFSKNERLITFVDSEVGKVGVVKVGATMVGSVKVAYGTVTTNISAGKIEKGQLEESISIGKGEEIGYFRFGSTVVLVFEKDKVMVLPEVLVGQPIKMGEKIAAFF